VSIPFHLAGPAIWTPIAVEGATWQMLNGNGFGFNWRALYVTSLIDAHSAWRQRADEFSDTLKDDDPVRPVRAEQVPRPLLREVPEPRALAARRLRRRAEGLRPAADADATAQGHAAPKPDAPRMEIIQRGFEMLPNTAPFDVTGTRR